MRSSIAFATLLTTLLASAPVLAQSQDTVSSAGDKNAAFFANIYSGTCLKFAGKPAELRTELDTNKQPQLPADKAKAFLVGHPGTAWLIANPGGSFVVSLRDDNVCAVYAQRANATEVEKRFIALVTQTGTPDLLITKSLDQQAKTTNGPTHTLAYTWSAAKAAQKMLFTLTTTTSNNSAMQAMASLAMVRN